MVGTTAVLAGLVERIVLVTTLLTAAAAAETYPILDLLLVARGRHMARAVRKRRRIVVHDTIPDRHETQYLLEQVEITSSRSRV